MTAPLLEVTDLSVEFAGAAGPVRPVDGVSFGLEAGGVLGIVGESGCGKSMTSLALMRLLPDNARIASGSVRFAGHDLTTLDERAMRRLRGNEISMIFQEPMTALNPVYTVGRQIGGVLRRHRGQTRREARSHAIELLSRVGIPAPKKRVDCYPHELSGGMRQRAMIAMALACRPRLLIADEPTTALDVTTQAQVLEQISELTASLGTAVIIITHDLGVIAETCDQVAVMYCGRVVEEASVSELFSSPRHRYTEGLVASMPAIDRQKGTRLPVIPGSVPDPDRLPPGCRFEPRCRFADARCRQHEPGLEPIGESRAACFHPAGAR